MRQCPYCNKQIGENARFCLGCGRQLDVDIAEGPQSGGISDLKKCFGSYPISQLECYLCADEQKCSNFAASTKQGRILNELDKLGGLQSALSKINESIQNMNSYLRSIDKNIATMGNNIRRG